MNTLYTSIEPRFGEIFVFVFSNCDTSDQPIKNNPIFRRSVFWQPSRQACIQACATYLCRPESNNSRYLALGGRRWEHSWTRFHSSDPWGSFSRPFGLRDGTGFRMLLQPVHVGRNVRTERLDLLTIPLGGTNPSEHHDYGLQLQS